MNTRYWLVGIVAITLLTSNGSARQSNPTDRPTLINRLAAANKTDTATIYEDIEIMRRLLVARLSGRDSAATGSSSAVMPYYGDYMSARNLRGLYSPIAASHPNDGRYSALSIEGVYVEGKGDLFTLTMPATQRDPLPTTGASSTNAVNEWERTRQQVRGESPDTTAKTDPPAPSTADLILSVLTEHGKHVRLKDNEDVTVVVTFRGSTVTPGAYPVLAYYDALTNLSAQSQSTPSTAPKTDPAGQGKSARDLFLLGNLHLRQQQYDQASEALQKAIDLEPNADPKQLAETFRKLAESKLHLGQLDEAKAMIESATVWEKKSKDSAASKSKPDVTPAAPRGATKLIITASKRQLDEVGSGKLSAEDFRKGIRIEMVTLPNFK